MFSVFAVTVSFVVMLIGTISLSALGVVAQWAVPLAVAGSGAIILVVLYLSGRPRSGSVE